MKTLFSLGGIMAILGLAVASTFAQTQNTTSSSTTYIQTSKFIGKPVKSSQGEEIGTVKDVVLDRNTGCMAYTVLSTSGGGGGGGKMVAVPWTVYSPTSDLSALTVTVERDRIYNAPVFDYARIEEYSRPEYISSVYSYYGVSPGGAVGVGVSGGTSTTTTGAATTTTGAATGAEAQAGAATSPGASAPSPAATTAEQGRRAHPGAAAAAGAAAVKARETATPSLSERAGERTPSAKQKQAKPTPPSGRSETGTRSESAKAPSEQTTTGEKATGSQRREKGKRGNSSPSEKPPGDE